MMKERLMSNSTAAHDIDVQSLTDSPIIASCSCGWRCSCSMNSQTAALMVGIAVERHAPGFDIDEYIRQCGT